MVEDGAEVDTPDSSPPSASNGFAEPTLAAEREEPRTPKNSALSPRLGCKPGSLRTCRNAGPVLCAITFRGTGRRGASPRGGGAGPAPDNEDSESETHRSRGIRSRGIDFMPMDEADAGKRGPEARALTRHTIHAKRATSAPRRLVNEAATLTRASIRRASAKHCGLVMAMPG